MKAKEFSEIIYRLYGNSDDGIKVCRNVTLQVTDACNLKCTYCYQTKKGHRMMTKYTAKKIVDLLYRMWDEDKEDTVINKKTQAIVLEFIGGEPFMNIDVVDYATEYFWMTALERKHIWADNFRVSIATNGVKYFDEKVQEYIKKYRNRLSMGVSIDGDKDMHDSCRVFSNGDGSWEIAKEAENHYVKKYNGFPHSKATISRDNLKYLDKTVGYFIDNGYKDIRANTIYEEDWNLEDAKVFYDKLKILADEMLEDESIEVSLFSEDFFHPLPEEELTSWCGGGGDMLSFDPDGVAFPCIRYMESSLNGEQKPVVIGKCDDGLYINEEESEWKKKLRGINRRTQNDDECFYCPIAAGCSHCIAYDYQKYGCFTKRDKGTCIMHKARSLANVYYWNKKYIKNGLNRRFKMYLPKEEALKIVSESEYKMLENLTKE